MPGPAEGNAVFSFLHHRVDDPSNGPQVARVEVVASENRNGIFGSDTDALEVSPARIQVCFIRQGKFPAVWQTLFEHVGECAPSARTAMRDVR